MYPRPWRLYHDSWAYPMTHGLIPWLMGLSHDSPLFAYICYRLWLFNYKYHVVAVVRPQSCLRLLLAIQVIPLYLCLFWATMPSSEPQKHGTTEPLHPQLPHSHWAYQDPARSWHVPDNWCDSMAIDFVGPLLLDKGYNNLITFTNWLGSDIRLIPTTTTLTAEHFTKLFFQHWYCENSLPLEIILDHDKLFLSCFWKELHTLTGIKLKMSIAYHPESDGSSKRTNKTVIQAIQFAVKRDQKSWVKALLNIHFNLMNTRNMSTIFTPFQLCFRKSAQILPPPHSTQPK